MAQPRLKLVAPTTEKRTVMPKRARNSELRTREYLTGHEIGALMDATRRNRYGHRDATMILVAFRHGLRASELVDLRWDQIDFPTANLHVRRVKKSTPSTHPIIGDELRALRRLQREQEPRSPFVFTSERRASELVDLRWDQIDFPTANLHVRRVKKSTPSTHPIIGDELRALRRLQREQEPRSPFVFTSERGAPFSTAGFARMVERAGIEAKLGFKAHPHMLRHACGHALANKGHDTRALQAYLGHKNIQHTVRYTELAPDRFKNFWRN